MPHSLLQRIALVFTNTRSMLQFMAVGSLGAVAGTIGAAAYAGVLGDTQRLLLLILIGLFLVQATVFHCVLLSTFYLRFTGRPTFNEVQQHIEQVEAELDATMDANPENADELQRVGELLRAAQHAGSPDECSAYLEEAEATLDEITSTSEPRE